MFFLPFPSFTLCFFVPLSLSPPPLFSRFLLKLRCYVLLFVKLWCRDINIIFGSPLSEDIRH
ncbi:hypothetical protein DVH24_042280 [Malus domestica]|uniref:Uncharacterized protein n=1 Tax=Malus domestica TaxID=3750 RepID=A0A498IXP0_MALDO|nr:hypothetical protein DVH24_042280 [Malus domestica]